jgi:hypothetical protein
MDTAPLKSFATWSRTALIREVTARIAVVLAPASPQRVEQPKAVAALDDAITAAGGGDKGRAAVADRVAYTWFNRIIALRFMDANGYTGIGIVSPQPGVEMGQPEILAEAKHANIDPEVVSRKVGEVVTGLLNGTVRSDDPQGEAYALLLAEYCRHWNRAMPFMFERQGDFTELLIPANLLADDSMLNRAVKVLTEEVCKDVEVVGWLYQFYISERKDEVFAGFKKGQKAGADEIPAATQLFTPHWIVRYLVENSLGRLWMLNRPNSRLAEQMEYYIPPTDTSGDFLKVSGPEEIKVIDPACGSGHILTHAFDLLYAIYGEEGYAPSDIPGLILQKNLYGTEIDPRAGALAAFSLAMKARARQRTFLSKSVEPNVCVLERVSFSPDEVAQLTTPGGDPVREAAFWNRFEDAETLGALICPDESIVGPLRRHIETWRPREDDLFGSDLRQRADRTLRQADYLSPKYHVVVANPPYMNSKNMSAMLADWLKDNYRDVKADLFAAFVVRNSRLARRGGHLGFMTPFTWMFITTYAKLRQFVLSETTITNLVQLEYSGFEGATVPICAFTLENCVTDSAGTYIRLADFKGPKVQAPRTLEAIQNPSASWRFSTRSREFLKVPGSPIVYWFPEQLLKLFEDVPTVSSVGRAAIGLITGDNAGFVRMWWEVSLRRIFFEAPDRETAKASHRRWFPYAKGGDFRRWAGNLEAVVNWENDGHALQNTTTADGSRIRAHNFNLDRIFKPGIAWTAVTSGALSFRHVGSGFLFDAAAGLCQGDDDQYLLALLNSDAVGQVLHGLNPTLNLHPGYLEAVPMPSDEAKDEAREIAARAIEISCLDWNSHERSWAFTRLPVLDRSEKIAFAIDELKDVWRTYTEELRALERQNNRHFGDLFGLSVVESEGDATSISFNPDFAYAGLPSEERDASMSRDMIAELVSYAVGCSFGRYSLEVPGLILADQGASLNDYLAVVPTPAFMPDVDNVIPIVDGEWFEDDIVTRFRQFLRVVFGEKHFEENLRFVVESLGVKDLRDYFVKSFYKDHVQRYKKRPIYWLFSSPKGSFNALIYMHRYTPSTVSTVLNEYLREFKAKLAATLGQQERHAAGGGTPRQQAAAQKEADRIRKMLLELDEYEHEVLYPLASQQIEIDLDNGVRMNYPKFGAALKKIPGLEAAE